MAIALLTREDLRAFGSTLKRVYTVTDTPGFSDLLEALDEAEASNAKRKGGL